MSNLCENDQRLNLNFQASPLPDRCTNAIFLREDLLLVPNTSACDFQVYHVPASSSSSPSIRLIFSLGLPPLANSMIIENIEAQCQPNPTQISMFPRHFPTKRPFMNDPTAAIIIFSISIIQHCAGSEDTDAADFVLVVHRKSLLDLIPFDFLEDPNALPTVIPWDSWGPPSTRWFDDDNFAVESIIYSHGQRFAQHLGSVAATNDFEDNNDTLTIYDFNPWHVREARLHKERAIAACDGRLRDFKIDIFGGDESERLALLPANICSAQKIFRFNIVGRLPYIRYSSSNWPNYEAVMIEEERLIGLQVRVSLLFNEFATQDCGWESDGRRNRWYNINGCYLSRLKCYVVCKMEVD